MRYAKLINNYPSYAPRRLRVGETWVYNPTETQLLDAGYLPVIETEPPVTDERHYAEPHWTEENGQIVQSWTVVEIPYDDTADKAEAYDILTGVNA